MDIHELIRRVEKKLDNQWPVDEDEIRALINYILENEPKK